MSDIGTTQTQNVTLYDESGNGLGFAAGNGLMIRGDQPTTTTASWTSATTVNTASTISVTGYNTVTVAMSNTSTMTAGVLTFEVSPDNTNWFPIAMSRIDSYTVETSYTLNAVANRAWSTSVDGFTNFRVRLSTVITGTGTASIFITPQTMPIEPIVSVGQATAANLNATVTGTVNPGNTANTTPWLIRLPATTTSSGLLINKVLSAANTTPIQIKTSAGQVYGWHLFNTSAAVRYARFFNVASAPTMGTTSPTFVIPLPAGGGAVLTPDGMGIPMATGIFYAITTGAADLDNTAGAANDVVGTIWTV